jgi:4'-phosphopantetheinyl transferase
MATSPTSRCSFQLASGEVHTWCVSLDVPSETSAGLYATLTNDERNRSARFRFERDRQRFIVSHGVLRDLLGRYVGTEPAQIRFVSNAFGKPALSPEFGSRLNFNLSHSAGLAIIAIAIDAEIGVDVERIRTGPGYAEIARHFFSAAEAAHLNGVSGDLHAQAFFNCWTKKEAYVKARGEGLGMPLTKFQVADPHGTWSLYTLQPAPGYIGALAIERSGWRLTQRRWQERLDESAR